MTEKNNYTGLYLIGIVAIVAIFGLVLMTKGVAAPSYASAPASQMSVVADDSNLAGDARWSPISRPSCTYKVICDEYDWITEWGYVDNGTNYTNVSMHYGCVNYSKQRVCN